MKDSRDEKVSLSFSRASSFTASNVSASNLSIYTVAYNRRCVPIFKTASSLTVPCLLSTERHDFVAN